MHPPSCPKPHNHHFISFSVSNNKFSNDTTFLFQATSSQTTLQVSIGLPILAGIYIALRWVTCVLLAGQPVDDVLMGAQQVLLPTTRTAARAFSSPLPRQAVAALHTWWLLWYLVVRCQCGVAVGCDARNGLGFDVLLRRNVWFWGGF